MNIHSARYGLTAALGSLAVASTAHAYPDGSFFIALSGSIIVGLFCSIVALP